MSRVKLKPVSGQVDTFDLTGADGQPFTPTSTRASGGLLGCTETVTIVHHIKGDEDDIFECHTVGKASWFSKTTISTSADGAKPANTYEVRIFGGLFNFEPSLGDYCVLGVVDGIEKPADLKNRVHFRITAISDNRRGGLGHWRVSGQ